ncbi:MAG: hypothetical protein HY827_09350 [Actinobacteria bacterium]|nr:hypothetical protein [Actinomycetota bacterium]
MSEKAMIGRDTEYWRFRPITLPNRRTAVFGTLTDHPVALDRGYSLAVFNSRGKLDHRFAGDGVFVKRYRYSYKRAFLANSAAGMANGSIAVCGNELMPDRTTSVVIKSYGMSGRLDPSFGNGGVFRYPHTDGYVDRCERLTALPELTMAVRSYRRGAGEPSVLRVVRLTQSGAYDPAFGAAGVAEMPGINRHGQTQSLQTYAITKDKQARLLLAFHGDVRHESYVARLTIDGSPDITFASGGYSIVPFNVYSIVQPTGGRLLVAGDRVVRSPWGDPQAVAVPCYGKLSEEGELDHSESSSGFKSLSGYDGTLSDPFTLSAGKLYFWGVRPIPKKRSDLFAFPGPPSRPIEIP